MPNWCNNSLTLTHTDPSMIARASKALQDGKFLQEFIPIPEKLTDTTSPNSDVEQAEALTKEFGYSSWYDFCVNEWGTKWDVESYGEPEVSDDGLSLTCGFDSAWAPPVEAYRKLEDLGFLVDAMYYEGGVGFCGEYAYGSDETYEIPGTSDEVDAEIPSNINECFGIAENMRMWEEEQMEDEAE